MTTTMKTRLPTKFKATTAALRMGMEPARVSLPYPPSLNDIFAKHNGKYLSENYRLWRDEAGWMLKQQKVKKTLGKVGISVMVCAPDKRRRDLDNVGFKAILDLLVKHGLIEGDDSRFVRAIHAEWIDQGQPCTVIIKPAIF